MSQGDPELLSTPDCEPRPVPSGRALGAGARPAAADFQPLVLGTTSCRQSGEHSLTEPAPEALAGALLPAAALIGGGLFTSTGQTTRRSEAEYEPDRDATQATPRRPPERFPGRGRAAPDDQLRAG